MTWSKLETLMESEGQTDKTEFAAEMIYDSVCPGICKNRGCDYVTNVEPDCFNGWCESCETNSVISGLALMGLI